MQCGHIWITFTIYLENRYVLSYFFFLISLQGHLNTYRFCDNVWTFVLNDVEFKNGDFVSVDKVKIVAVDGKSSAAAASQD